MSSTAAKIGIGVVALVVLLPLSLIILGVMAVSTASTAAAADAATQPTGGQLSPDAPIPPQFVQWVNLAGSLCPEITPAAIAAQIDVESSFRPDAYADYGSVPAMGIAQFTAGTWATWGKDYDHDGTNSPWDPEDGIMAMGTLMCAHVKWATDLVAKGVLHGDILDLAWGAYYGGRGTILKYGRLPTAAEAPGTNAYPKLVRDRISKFAAPSDTAGGAPPAAGLKGWVLPLPPGHKIGSKFAQRCMTLSNGSTRCRMHWGDDIPATTGTPIYAAHAGTVVTASCDSPYCDHPGYVGLGGCGNHVKIDHGNQIGTMYCHMVRMNVTKGQHVEAGQVIGWVGSTGDSSGPHLHFQVFYNIPPFDNTRARDPEVFLRSVGLVFK
jgi:Peptidase family M23/Transglycosylase SLT domain